MGQRQAVAEVVGPWEPGNCLQTSVHHLKTRSRGLPSHLHLRAHVPSFHPACPGALLSQHLAGGGGQPRNAPGRKLGGLWEGVGRKGQGSLDLQDRREGYQIRLRKKKKI